MAYVHMTLKSRNAKTGDIPVSTTSAGTCPTACPFRADNVGGCYAASGPLAMHWRKVTSSERGTDWNTFCDTVASLPEGALWRHNQAGDLPGEGNKIDRKALRQLVKANAGRKGFTYTHKPMTNAANRKAIHDANKAGFTINLSGNNLTHADTLAALDIGPVVVVLASDHQGNTVTPEGRKVIQCPATRADLEARGKAINCKDCGLCAIAQRDFIVGFPAHGSAVKRATAVAMS